MTCCALRTLPFSKEQRAKAVRTGAAPSSTPSTINVSTESNPWELAGLDDDGTRRAQEAADAEDRREEEEFERLLAAKRDQEFEKCPTGA